MKFLNLIVGVILGIMPGFIGTAQANEIHNAVVKVFVTANPVDYYRPWQTMGIQPAGGSGFIIEGNRVLTNAHVVAEHTFVQLKKNKDPRRYIAKVEAVGYDCDLAILSVDDPDFFKGTTPLVFGGLPTIQDQVMVVGYPQGGDTISITKGVVSRIELTAYSQSARQLLAVQIDAAINPGNSGGPVLLGDKVVGVAMQVLQSSQNIGYMIPVPVIQHFFDDLTDDHYDGFPMLGIDYQSTENKGLRDYYKIENIKGGVVVTNIIPFAPADGVLRRGDVILSIDGVLIEEDGTYPFHDGERLALPYLITQKQMGETVRLELRRQGEVKKLSVTLGEFKPLVAFPNFYERPPYYIYGGLVFSVLSSDLMKSWGQRWWEKAPFEFTHYIAGSGRLNTSRNQDIVVLLNVLPDAVNAGYHDFGNDVMTKIDGREITGFREFVEYLHAFSGEYLTLETERGSSIILDVKWVKQSITGILQRNQISDQFSPDMADWFDLKKNEGEK